MEDGDDIKVLEIRGGQITTRTLRGYGKVKFKKWVIKG